MRPHLTKLFKQYMKVPDPDKAHAALSASGSERWLRCPGSVRMSRGRKMPDTEWSKLGTNAHTLLQFILENEEWMYLLTTSEAKPFKQHIGYTNEQLSSVLIAENFVRETRDGLPHLHELLVEKKVELPGVGFGTSDIILYQPFGILHVMDYKNGRSVVEPEENTQGLYYAVAAAELYGWDFSEVWITIVQPNAPHKKGPVRTWKTTPKRLERAQLEFLAGARRTRNPQAPLVPDPKICWFCSGRQVCPAQTKIKHQKAVDLFQR